MFSKILHITFPEKCSLCQKRFLNWKEIFCEVCRNSIHLTSLEGRCVQCGEIKEHCLCLERKFYFSKSFFLMPYNKFPNKKLLKTAKFENQRWALKLLKRFLRDYIKENYSNFENHFILPIPSSKKLVKFLSKNFQKFTGAEIKFLFKKSKKKQSKLLNQKDRFIFIEKSLSLREKKCDDIKDKNVLLIDDIWTTGATLNFAAKLLNQTGVTSKQIKVFTLARQERLICD